MGKDVADDGSLILRHGNVAMLRRLLAHTKVIFFLFYNVLYWIENIATCYLQWPMWDCFPNEAKNMFNKIY